MRVLTVVHSYPPGATGGAEHRAERTTRALHALGHDVRVLSVDWQATDGLPAAVDDAYRQIPVRRVWLTAGDRNPPRDAYDNPRVAAAVTALIGQWRPDIIHQYSGYLTSSAVVEAASALGVPVVLSLTDYWWLCHRITLVRTTGRVCQGPTPALCALCHAQRRRRVRWPSLATPQGFEMAWRWAGTLPIVMRSAAMAGQRARAALLMRRLDSFSLLLAPSAFLAGIYAHHGIEPSRVRVMRQGVEGVRHFDRRRSQALRVGYLGQIKRHKGVDLLIDAWSLLRERGTHQLSLFGPRPGEAQYRQRLERRSAGWPEVRWRDAVSRDELWTVLAALDVLVVPSRWAENSPNVILEAQAARVPVVGARIGGIPELVHHDINGLLFDPGSAADLARQLQRLADDPGLVDRLHEGSIAVRTVEDEARELVRLYEDASRGSRAVPPA